MVKLPSVKDSARQMQGLNSENDSFTQRMVRRFERTGEQATFREQRMTGGKNPTANLTGKRRANNKIVSRIKNGGGGFTVEELKEQWEKPTKAESRPIYPCAVCGKDTPWHCKVGKGAPPRCLSCRREARLASKRATWHKHKDNYSASAGERQRARRQARRAERDARLQAELDEIMNSMPRQWAPARPPKMPAVPKPVAPPEPVAPPVQAPAPKGPVVVWTP